MKGSQEAPAGIPEPLGKVEAGLAQALCRSLRVPGDIYSTPASEFSGSHWDSQFIGPGAGGAGALFASCLLLGKPGPTQGCGLAMPTVPSIPSRVGQRGSGLSMSAARSEHEVSEIIDGLSEQEVRRRWGPCWTYAARAIIGVGVSLSCLAPPDPPLSALTEFMEPAQLHLLSLCAQGPGEYVRRLPPPLCGTRWGLQGLPAGRLEQQLQTGERQSASVHAQLPIHKVLCVCQCSSSPRQTRPCSRSV